jgi:UDP-galactopyranose mutase
MAWLEGKEVEYYFLGKVVPPGWFPITKLSDFDQFDQVRIKPQPIVREEYLVRFDNEQGMFYPCQQETSYGQIKLTYKDNILINAEVIK